MFDKLGVQSVKTNNGKQKRITLQLIIETVVKTKWVVTKHNWHTTYNNKKNPGDNIRLLWHIKRVEKKINLRYKISSN